MSTSNRLAPATNATLDDCVRLWITLTTEYIPGLRVELIPELSPFNTNLVRLELVDYATLVEGQELHRSLWATKQFVSPLYLISYSQLFDLLISGYRVIEEFFRTGKDNRPRPQR